MIVEDLITMYFALGVTVMFALFYMIISFVISYKYDMIKKYLVEKKKIQKYEDWCHQRKLHLANFRP